MVDSAASIAVIAIEIKNLNLSNFLNIDGKNSTGNTMIAKKLNEIAIAYKTHAENKYRFCFALLKCQDKDTKQNIVEKNNSGPYIRAVRERIICHSEKANNPVATKAIIILLSLGAYFRMFDLGNPGFWGDEETSSIPAKSLALGQGT